LPLTRVSLWNDGRHRRLFIEADRGRRLRLVWKDEGAPAASPSHEADRRPYLIEHDLPAAQVQREPGPTGFRVYDRAADREHGRASP
jgi:hypothetical protein